MNKTCGIFAELNTNPMISKTLIRYIWLLNTILQDEHPSLDRISFLWERSGLGDGSPLAPRSFHQHHKGIKEVFGVDIECDRSRNVYYVKNQEVLDESNLSKWLLHNYSIPQDFVTFNGMKDRILLENIPLGKNFRDSIIDAMHRNVELLIDYQRYETDLEGEHLQTFHMQPYAMKVYNHRWYLLGYLKEQNGIRTIALDRILHLKVLKTKFTLPERFDARKYFENVIGIYTNKDLPVVEVKIRAYGVQAEYLRSVPLHKSQSEGRSKHGEFAEFTYRLCITPELISQLLAMGDKIEVLEPESFREEIKRKLICCLTKYQ